MGDNEPTYRLSELLNSEALEAGVKPLLEWQDSSDYVQESHVRRIVLAVVSAVDRVRSRQSDERDGTRDE